MRGEQRGQERLRGREALDFPSFIERIAALTLLNSSDLLCLF
jgi:hypothetical protein